MVKPGDIVFFKKSRESSRRKCNEVTFKGHGFGVFLGHVPPFAPDPPRAFLMRIMGQSGFLGFDDVAEFLGDEAGAKCVTMFEDKYYGKVVADPETGAKLTDATGRPLSVVPTIESAVSDMQPSIERGPLPLEPHP